jgi:putative hydrolase of the HAD superfamily
MAGVEVVLFDLDNTLFRHTDAATRGLTAHLKTHGLPFTAEERARWEQLEELHYHRYLAGDVDVIQMRQARAREFLAAHGIIVSQEEARAWFDGYLTQYRAGWSLYDDVQPCLDALADFRIGIITNASLAFQADKVEATGLSSSIEHLVASAEVGFAKPDARIFAVAASQFGVPVESCAYVGDRQHTDAVGATDAGMLGIWLDRHDASPASAAEAAERGIPRITSLAELPALVYRG